MLSALAAAEGIKAMGMVIERGRKVKLEARRHQAARRLQKFHRQLSNAGMKQTPAYMLIEQQASYQADTKEDAADVIVS